MEIRNILQKYVNQMAQPEKQLKAQKGTKFFRDKINLL